MEPKRSFHSHPTQITPNQTKPNLTRSRVKKQGQNGTTVAWKKHTSVRGTARSIALGTDAGKYCVVCRIMQDNSNSTGQMQGQRHRNGIHYLRASTSTENLGPRDRYQRDRSLARLSSKGSQNGCLKVTAVSQSIILGPIKGGRYRRRVNTPERLKALRTCRAKFGLGEI